MGSGLSEPPQKKHPWAKYYAERGLSRPPMADVVRPPAEKKPPVEKELAAQKPAELSPELAEIVAKITDTKPGTTATPFITVMQKEAVAREVRRRARWRWARYAAIAAVAGLLLHVAVTRFFHRTPTQEALDRHAQAIATEVLPLYTSAQQPLLLKAATIKPGGEADARHLHYVVEVTLQLQQPLYVPANTNGTENYRRLQESLQSARAQELKFKLFPAAGAPEAPELPLLIQVVHRAGETFKVRVPFAATRAGWGWHLEPAALKIRGTQTPFHGATLAHYAESSHLVFGTSEGRAEIRRRERLARDYIVAVTREIQKRADFQAVPELPPETPETDQPLAPGNAPAIDPTQPALPAAATPALDPNTPAVDPDAPAIELPANIAPPPLKAPPPAKR